MFILGIDLAFKGFTGMIPTRDAGKTLEKLVNHGLKASDLQAFRVFSQHPNCVITPVNP